MGNLTGSFLNKTENNIPEFYIEATDPSSQFLLWQIHNRYYGDPYVLDATVVPGANLVSQVLFSFGAKAPLYKKSLADIDFQIFWKSRDNKTVTKQGDTYTVRNLYFSFSNEDWDMIKDFQPKLIKKIYKPTHNAGYASDGTIKIRPAGFKHPLNNSVFPIADKLSIIDIKQEDHFNFGQLIFMSNLQSAIVNSLASDNFNVDAVKSALNPTLELTHGISMIVNDLTDRIKILVDGVDVSNTSAIISAIQPAVSDAMERYFPKLSTSGVRYKNKLNSKAYQYVKLQIELTIDGEKFLISNSKKIKMVATTFPNNMISYQYV